MDRLSEARKRGLLAAGEQAATPTLPSDGGFGAELEVNVIYTTWLGTQIASHTASRWARCLNARIVLWFPQVVPRQFSITAPPVSTKSTEDRLQSFAVACCEDLEIEIRVCLCRDEEQCLLNVLEPDSVVLMGGKRRWFPTQEQKLATLLHSHGHRVLFIHTHTKENVPAAPQAPERTPT